MCLQPATMKLLNRMTRLSVLENLHATVPQPQPYRSRMGLLARICRVGQT